MNIIINTISLLKDINNERKNFIAAYILNILDTHPEHSFFILTDGTINDNLQATNATVLATTPKSKNILLWKIWYAYKLPACLKKYKATIFINIDAICSLKTTVPQCILVNDLTLETVLFSKKNVTAFIDKAAMLVTFSQYEKNKIARQYPTAGEKTEVIHQGASTIFLPIDDIEKENTKEKYTAGKEYFLFTGEINTTSNLINLLKAFSFFKKRQKSNMQLIIVTKAISPDDPFIKSLQSYKYRDEVKILFDAGEEETVKITAAAYALVYATTNTNFYLPVLQAMQCGVPVIVSNTTIMKEVCDTAALFTDPEVFENIADKMMLLFKDENKRNELITKGKHHSAQYSIAATNKIVWQNISKCAGVTA